jgi:ligand-binding sensor domain-containing protein
MPPDEAVLALAAGPYGAVWAGTDGGVARLTLDAKGKPSQVERFGGPESGLPSARIQALSVSPSGEVWAGSDRGVARFDGETWQTYTAADSGLADDYVSVVEAGDDVVWLGTQSGISRFEPSTGTWQAFTPEGAGPASAAIGDLEMTPDGTLWAGTLGGGLGAWDGASWHNYVTSNSDLPLNTVQRLYATPGGELWAGLAFAAQPGGIVSRVSDGEWTSYGLGRSGYSGGEPLSFAEDVFGRIWIGTRAAGIDIYAPRS